MKYFWCTLFYGVIFSGAAAAGLQLDEGKVSVVTQLAEAKVEAVLSPYAHRELMAADIDRAVEDLTRALHDAGAFAAKVYVRQDAVANRVTLEVIEGRLAEDGIVLSGDPGRLDFPIIRDQLTAALAPGSVLTMRKLERAILLTNDLPGIATTRNTLRPGIEVGEARLEVTTVPSALVKGSAYSDNFGSAYTGRYRAGGVVELNSPFHRGDKVTLGANVSDLGSTYVDLDASFPLLNHGLRFGARASRLDYRTDEPTGNRGRSREAGVYLGYPVIRSRQLNLYGEAQWNWTGMEDVNDLTTISDRKIQVGSLQLRGDHSDGWGGGGTTTGQLEVYLGHLDLSGYAPNEALDDQTAKTAGQFSRTVWRLGRMQHLRGSWQAFVEASGQIASKNLDSSQAISFGGPYYFSGYQSGEILGNEGHMLHADLRYNVPAVVWGGRQQWSLFYDIGGIRTHAVDVIGGIIVPGVAEHSYTLQSLGIGFSQQWSRVKLQGALGRRMHNEIPDALLADHTDGVTNFWLHLTYNF